MRERERERWPNDYDERDSGCENGGTDGGWHRYIWVGNLTQWGFFFSWSLMVGFCSSPFLIFFSLSDEQSNEGKRREYRLDIIQRFSAYRYKSIHISLCSVGSNTFFLLFHSLCMSPFITVVGQSRSCASFVLNGFEGLRVFPLVRSPSPLFCFPFCQLANGRYFGSIPGVLEVR